MTQIDKQSSESRVTAATARNSDGSRARRLATAGHGSTKPAIMNSLETEMMHSDIAPAIAAHLDHVYIRMCALVSKKWSRIFSSEQIWQNLCNRNFKGASRLIVDCQDPGTPIRWKAEYTRLNSLLRFDQPARPEIDPSSLEAALEIRFDRRTRYERGKRFVIGNRRSSEESKDSVALRVHGFSLIDEDSEVQPGHRTCVLRGEVDSADAALLDRLRSDAENCILRTYLLDRAKGRVTLLHNDDPDGGYLGVALSRCVPFPVAPFSRRRHRPAHSPIRFVQGCRVSTCALA